MKKQIGGRCNMPIIFKYKGDIWQDHNYQDSEQLRIHNILKRFGYGVLIYWDYPNEDAFIDTRRFIV